jgi:hypothetical protein
MGWTTGVQLLAGEMMGFFLFAIVSRPALGPTQPPIQWILRALSLGIKQPACEADHSPLSCAEVKTAWTYTFILPYLLVTWCLIKQEICLYGVVLG